MDAKIEKELLEIGKAGGSGDMTAKEIFFAIADFYDNLDLNDLHLDDLDDDDLIEDEE